MQLKCYRSIYYIILRKKPFNYFLFINIVTPRGQDVLCRYLQGEKKNLVKLTQCKYVTDSDPEWLVRKIKYNKTEIRLWWKKWMTKWLKYVGFVYYQIKLYFFQLFLSVNISLFEVSCLQPADFLPSSSSEREWKRERSIFRCITITVLASRKSSVHLLLLAGSIVQSLQYMYIQWLSNSSAWSAPESVLNI